MRKPTVFVSANSRGGRIAASIQRFTQAQENQGVLESRDSTGMRPESVSKYSRNEFLRIGIRSAGALAVLCTMPQKSASQSAPVLPPAKVSNATHTACDLREFVRWILEEFEPSVRLPGGAGHYARQPGQTTPALYGVADMACTLYTIGAPPLSTANRAGWTEAFQLFQNPNTGWFQEKDPNPLSPQHNTAFALAAMQLLDLAPRFAVKMDSEYSDMRSYLSKLNWRTAVYQESHKGAGIGSIYALVPALRSPDWFKEYFSICDSLFDRNNGLMGRDKPVSGDIDQIGGTFHYSFLYQFFNRQMPYPKERIDTVLHLQRPDGYWSPVNHLWMTLDAIYLMTRTLRYCPHRLEDVRASVRHILTVLQQDVFSGEGRKSIFTKKDGVHSLTAAISIAAEAQQFLGAHEVITDWPLKLVLDRRPFI